MKKLLAFLVVATVVSSVTGCGCCRRLRDIACRGAYCGGAPAAVAPMVAAPMPMMAAPMAACSSCPPQSMAYDPGCGYSGMQTLGYGGYDMGSAGVVDSGWSASCPDCQGGVIGTPSYDLPSYGSPTYDGPTQSYEGSSNDPGPAPTN